MDISLLKYIPIFSELSETDLQKISRAATKQLYRKDNMILIEEEIGSTMFIILNGRVKISRISDDGREVILSILSEGDFFGEVSVLTGRPRTATICAAGRAELLRLDKDKLDAVIEDHPRVHEILEEFYKKRAKHTVDAMVESLKKRS